MAYPLTGSDQQWYTWMDISLGVSSVFKLEPPGTEGEYIWILPGSISKYWWVVSESPWPGASPCVGPADRLAAQ